MPILTTLGAACARAWGFTSGLVKDQYFNLVSLLLPGNGTNGAQNNTFLDSSTNNFTITRNGNTTQGTFSPFSQTGWGNLFNGSNAYFNFAAQTDFAFGTGDFTIETFVFLNSTGDQTIIDFRPSSTNGAYPLIHVAGGKFNYYANTAGRIDSDSSVVANRWYHLVVSRVGTTTRMFVDGVAQTQTYSDSTNYIVGTSRPTIGVGGFNLTAYLNGYLSNFRVLKGTGFTTVTVPTAPFATGTTNQVLLTCQANRFVDSNTATTAKTITVNGSPSVVAFSPFAPTAAYTTAAVGGSGYFDGTGDYVEAPNSTNLDVGTGDFSIEAWCYKTNTSTATDWRVAGGSALSSGFFGDGGTASSRGFGIGRTGVAWDVTSNVQAPIYEWFHICYTRKSGDVRIFLNGKLIAYAAGNTNNYGLNAGTLQIAAGQGAQTLTGYMTGFRLFKTVPASYDTTVTTINTQVFTPPTSPPTAITNTQLLLNFTNAGITDATAKNDLETVGNAQISTSVSKFGGGSIAFDGTGDWLVIPSSNLFILGTGDFTIEAWGYPSVVGGGGLSRGLFQITSSAGFSTSATNSLAVATTNPSGNWGCIAANAFNNSSTAAVVNTWYHLALVRNSGTTKLYVNGTSVLSFADTTNYTCTFLTIGGYYDTNNIWNGYIDDFRITKGVARYTGSTYTVPTAPFPVQ